jgi:hypothetical protein
MPGVWKKTLYERTGLPDNYTPKESFLAAIQRNKGLRLYSRTECLQGASVLGRELSLVFTFWSLYLYLRYDLLITYNCVLNSQDFETDPDPPVYILT